MPRPKTNTGYRAGNSATFLPIIHKFFKLHPPPSSWGKQKMPWHRAFFLAAAAARPAFLDDGELLIGVGNNHNSFIQLFQTDPDYFVKFVSFFRQHFTVTTYADMAKAFLREGAVQKFRDKEARDPTDGELSRLIKDEHGVEVPTETFGDARRQATLEDKEIERLMNSLSDDEQDFI